VEQRELDLKRAGREGVAAEGRGKENSQAGWEGGDGGVRVMSLSSRVFICLFSAPVGPPRLTWVALEPTGLPLGSSYPSYRDTYK